MAIQNDYVTDFGVTVNDAYIRATSGSIVNANGEKLVTITRKVYANKAQSDEEMASGGNKEIPGSHQSFTVQDKPAILATQGDVDNGDAQNVGDEITAAVTEYTDLFAKDLTSGFKKNVRDFGIKQSYEWLKVNDPVCVGGVDV